MKKGYVMALDQGTTSSRCILFDRRGQICSMAQREFPQYYPKAGWVEHNPMEIWSSQMSVATEAMSKIGADATDVAAIGITNQRETTMSGIERQENLSAQRLYGSAAERQIKSIRWLRRDMTRLCGSAQG